MRFTVQAPDGRKVTLEGDYAPTEQELNQIFNNVGGNNTQEKDYTLGRLGTIDRGVTFGLGRKAGGFVNAIGSKIADAAITGGEIVANIQNKGLSGAFDEVEKKPSFWERYHEVVDPTMEAINQYHADKPVEAFALELGSSIANPANKLGVNYIKNGTSLANTALRSSAVGGGIGTVAGALNAEKTEDVLPYSFGGGVVGAVIGGALPLAANRAGAVYNAGKRIFMPEASVAGARKSATGTRKTKAPSVKVRFTDWGTLQTSA
jgi:hypothetical protein